jgi:predicted RNA binding protein YcfA (HicA-like mRNA interferase family)
MAKLPIVKSQELVRVFQKMGFFEHHRVGSHFQYKHPDGRRTTTPVHYGKDVPVGTLRAILRDIEISPKEFTSFLKK